MNASVVAFRVFAMLLGRMSDDLRAWAEGLEKKVTSTEKNGAELYPQGAVVPSGAESNVQDMPEGSGSVMSSGMMGFVSGFMERRYASSDRSFLVWSAGVKLLPKIWEVRGMEQTAKISTDEVSETRLSEARTQLGREIREVLLDLGPAFVKGGQLLSTRLDILAKEYITELSVLQDKVPPFSGEVAVRVIEEELGKPIDQLFSKFSVEPLAAASLGQVHYAEGFNGEKYAVKVQRQGLLEQFKSDLDIMRNLAKLTDFLDKAEKGVQSDWLGIYEEYCRILYEEIDYTIEASHMERFYKDFANTPWVKVPLVYKDLSSSSVLTMEYVPGIKINDKKAVDKANIDSKLVARRATEAYLMQVCKTGFYHSDPHPGNMAVDPKNGRLIYYDFGCMNELPPETRRGFTDVLEGTYQNDPKLCIEALKTLGIAKPGLDNLSLLNLARNFLDEFNSTLEQNGTYANDLSPDEYRAYRRAKRAKLGRDLFSIGTDTPLLMPAKYTFIYRALVSLDGIGKALDPPGPGGAGYDLNKLAKPYIVGLLNERDGSSIVSALRVVGKRVGLRPKDISDAVQGPRKVAYVEDFIRRVEQGDFQIRVRDPESERYLQRVTIEQRNIHTLFAVAMLLNAGLAIGAGPQALLQRALQRMIFGGAAIGAVRYTRGLGEIRKFDKETKNLGMGR
jgi:predicted unusual protein kinase regulating ubiquinone biosynthesis (AarF/ABC1/UbiB family)